MKPRSIKTKHRIVARLEADILKRIRAHEGLSRVDLARELHLAPSTAGIYVDRLIREEFIYESAKMARGQGRPPTMLKLNPGRGRFIGVKFHAHGIRAVSVDFSNQVLHQTEHPLAGTEPAAQVLGLIEDTIAELIAAHPQEVLGIGVGAPGVVDPVAGVVRRYTYIKDFWEGVSIRDRLAGKFLVPVHLENNIRAMALAEMWFGQGRGVENFICLGLLTGIAAGIVVGGQIHRGHDNQAGEIATWPALAPPSARVAGNGKIPTIEELAAIPALLAGLAAELRAGARSRLTAPVDSLSLAEVVRAAGLGDELVLRALARQARVLAGAAFQMALLFNPQKIIVGGPMTQFGDHLLAPLRDEIRRLDRHGFCATLEITCSALGLFNGALGAAALALHQWKPDR
jgi:glucokinase